MPHKIAIIGAGSWGTALARLLADKGHDVLLWAFEPEVAEGIETTHRNPLYLSAIELPESIRATTKLSDALAGRELIISVVPSIALRRVWQEGARHLDRRAIIVSCTKGIEEKGFTLMSEVLHQSLPALDHAHLCVLSGPSFAQEVAEGLPTSVVIAGDDATTCRTVQEAFRTDAFLTFTHDDVIGVEVGGAVKNVIAIAAGLSDGLGFGHNARAAIITRGLYEMTKIGRALGANPLTFMGLSGIGDLVLTCTGKLSRNHRVGLELGQGKALEEIQSGMQMIAEGITTTAALHRLAVHRQINTPICAVMYRILYEGLKPKEAVRELCTMPLKEELRAIMT